MLELIGLVVVIGWGCSIVGWWFRRRRERRAREAALERAKADRIRAQIEREQHRSHHCCRPAPSHNTGIVDTA